MIIGIVGAEGAKFTPLGKDRAIASMMSLVSIADFPDITIVSGECHLGGIDIWAKEMAHRKVVPIKRVCEVCGIEFTRSQRFNYKEYKTCSRKCQGIQMWRTRRASKT